MSTSITIRYGGAPKGRGVSRAVADLHLALQIAERQYQDAWHHWMHPDPDERDDVRATTGLLQATCLLRKFRDEVQARFNEVAARELGL